MKTRAVHNVYYTFVLGQRMTENLYWPIEYAHRVWPLEYDQNSYLPLNFDLRKYPLKERISGKILK